MGQRMLYRSRDAVLGGVCAGSAAYFNVDPVVARILTVVFAALTAGLLAVAYVAMWAVVPKEPDSSDPVEVTPRSVHSDFYGPR